MLTTFKRAARVTLSLALVLSAGGAATGAPRQNAAQLPAASQGTQPTETLPGFPKKKPQRGSLGTNLNGVKDWSTQFPFLNLAKQARPWISQKAGAAWGQGGELDLDGDGWVRSLQAGQSADMIFISLSGQGLPFNRFVVRYTGTGEVAYNLAARKVGDCGQKCDLITVNDQPGSYAVLRIVKTASADHIRDISIVPEPYLEEFDRGEIFNPIWIDRLAGLRALRFMDWAETNNSKQSRWEDRPKVSDASWALKGVPIEIMLQLANKLGADPWFNVPHLADEAYVRSFAELVRRELRPGLNVYVEHSNEVWNWQFQQAQYANKTGRARWGDVGNAYMQWHGMRTAQICDVWKKGVFKGQSNRVVCVLGVQAGWRGMEKAALDCPKWVAEGNEPCYRHGVDALAIAGYFGGCLDGNAEGRDVTDTIRAWFAESDGGFAKAFEQLRDGRHFSCRWTISGLVDVYKYYKDVATNYGLSLVAYEGGQHITGGVGSAADDPSFVNFHIALNRDPRMKEIYIQNFNKWKDGGGALFMHYVDVARSSKWGSWGALEHLKQQTTPKWESIREFNDNVRCWWDRCK